MKLGIDRIRENPNLLSNLGRVGIVTNQAVTDSRFAPACQVIFEAIEEAEKSGVSAVFGPQHGYFQTEQYNMDETPDSIFEFVGGQKVPLYSLYSKNRIPTKEQIENIDTFVFDLIDVGCRIYTYMLTLAGCLKSASLHDKKVIVLDRPNPLGLSYHDGKNWKRVEGNILDMRWESFVGWYPISMRHGLTMAELGSLFIKMDNLTVDYKVVGVEGLKRKEPLSTFAERPYTLPSPNLPSWLSNLFFPAFVPLEGTMVSEGRGTTLPFQIVGSPYFKVQEWLKYFEKLKNKFPRNFGGIRCREHHFKPTFNTHKDIICKGVQFHVEGDISEFSPFSLGIHFLAFACSHKEFEWREPGYEYNDVDAPINLILGNEKWKSLFDKIHKNQSLENYLDELNILLAWADKSAQQFAEETRLFHLYP